MDVCRSRCGILISCHGGKSNREFRVHERRISSAITMHGSGELRHHVCQRCLYNLLDFRGGTEALKPPPPTEIFSRPKHNAISQENWVNKQRNREELIIPENILRLGF